MDADYYLILDVSPSAAPDEIKRNYRQLVRENHPDIAPDPEAAHARMQLILQAYSVLSNVEARTRYDREVARAQGRPQPQSPQTATDESMPYVRPRRRDDLGTGAGVPVPEVVRRARAAQNMRQTRESGVQSRNPRTRLLTMVFEAAQLFFVEKRDGEAIAMCHRVLQSDPRNPEAAALLGDIYLAQERKDLALLMFERAMRAQPTNRLYKKKWDALRRGEPVPASTFARATSPEDIAAASARETVAASEANSAAEPQNSEAASSDGTEPNGRKTDDERALSDVPEVSVADLRAKLNLAPTAAPVKEARKPLLGKLFGRGK